MKTLNKIPALILFLTFSFTLSGQQNPRLVKDINPDADSAFFHYTSVGMRDVVGNTFYFWADDGVHGNELWASTAPDYDGQSTYLLKDISAAAGATSKKWSIANNKLFFLVGSNSTGGLYRSDGSPQGTSLIYSPACPKNRTCLLTDICTSNGQIFWTQSIPPNGPFLLENYRTSINKTDPVSGATIKLKDVVLTYWMADLNNTLISYAQTINGPLSLWKSDGTSRGTVQYFSLPTLPDYSGYPPDRNGHPYIVRKTWCIANGNIYFVWGDASYGYELWKTNGTAAGTYRITDINPGAGTSSPAMCSVMNGFLYFSANDGTNGYQIWRYPVTGNGVAERVTNINGGTTGADPEWITTVGNTLFFSAYRDLEGRELWASNGKPLSDPLTSTYLIKDIHTNEASSNPNYFNAYADDYIYTKFAYNMAVIGDVAYFAADDGSGYSLWRSDGTSGGTFKVEGINVLSTPRMLTPVNNKLFFAAYKQDLGYELWIYDPMLELGKRSAEVINLDSKDYSINIYPNPANDQLTIDGDLGSKADLHVKLLNLLGQEVQFINILQAKSIHEVLNLSGLTPGIYIIEMSFGSEIVQQKIIKK